MKKDSLGDRMKGYENVSNFVLTNRIPVIIRIDGKAFHTFTKGCKRPFDDLLMNFMNDTAIELCKNVQGCKLAYVQSDEISLLLTDYDQLDTQSWFDYRIEKMCSVSSSIATLAFNKSLSEKVKQLESNISYSVSPDTDDFADWKFWNNKQFKAMFDSRAFNVPKEDVCNYFIWRQQDCTRNSIQMIGQSNFTHKQLQGKSCNNIQEMLWQEKNINFNDFPVNQKRGRTVIRIRNKWTVDNNIPIFTQDRDYIESLVYLKNTDTENVERINQYGENEI